MTRSSWFTGVNKGGSLAANFTDEQDSYSATSSGAFSILDVRTITYDATNIMINIKITTTIGVGSGIVMNCKYIVNEYTGKSITLW